MNKIDTRMQLKRIVGVMLGVGLFSQVEAQEFQPLVEQSPTVGLAISPIPFGYQTAEINLDLRLAERHWLTLAPRVQFGTQDDYVYEASDAIDQGFGLGLTYRYFPLSRLSSRRSDGVGPFVAFGLRYQQTDYVYDGGSYQTYEDVYGLVGTTYYDQTEYRESLSQVAADFNIGYVMRVFDILYAEAFMGLGTRFSGYAYDPVRGLNLGQNQWDTGYSGYTLNGGLRVGIFLNKYKR
jgi:hypothetical protein